jgi:hypothetical protein
MSERGSILADSLAAAALLTAGMMLLVAMTLAGQSAFVRSTRMGREMENLSALRIAMMVKGVREYDPTGK